MESCWLNSRKVSTIFLDSALDWLNPMEKRMVSDTMAKSGSVIDTGRNSSFKLSGMSCLVESVLAGVSVTNLAKFEVFLPTLPDSKDMS